MEQNSFQAQLRSGLEFSPQQHQGKPYVVVKDSVTGRYFRFTESQAAILDLLRDPIDAETLAARASEKIGARIPVTTIEGFLKSLEEKCLLETPSVREKLAGLAKRKLDDEGFPTGSWRRSIPKRSSNGYRPARNGHSRQAFTFSACLRSSWDSC